MNTKLLNRNQQQQKQIESQQKEIDELKALVSSLASGQGNK
jgi:cell division protein FtsB